MKDITLALGGGGVKGNAHIGVLRVLNRQGFNIKALAGTSAGGLFGAFYAFGYSLDEISRRFSALDPATVYHREPQDGPAWLGLSGVHKLLEESLGDCAFDELRVPFAVTAVDLDTAECVALRSGRLMDAILATIAVPGVFPPVEIDGRKLVDGGVLSPVPVGLARSLAPDLPVVAVVLSSPMDEWAGVDKPLLLSSLPFLSNVVARLRMAQALNIFMRSISISNAMLTELLLKVEKPDVIICPSLPNIGLLDQVDVQEVARLGEQAAELALPALNRAVGMPARLARIFRQRNCIRSSLPAASDSAHGGDHDA
ncbi:MAG: patatin-like phospholipase family protein [Anaerolineales bacterium]|nr:patatin-like phospholipase family protein [Anaerolineales bacterium]